jgi:hypothetical protein
VSPLWMAMIVSPTLGRAIPSHGHLPGVVTHIDLIAVVFVRALTFDFAEIRKHVEL